MTFTSSPSAGSPASADSDLTVSAGIRVERHDDVALVLMDVPGRSQNVLGPELGNALERAVDEIEADEDIQAVVLGSGKPGSFLAGADVELLHQVKDVVAATDLARDGQRLTARIAACTKPIVAAIRGPCLGAGLELALACRERIAANDTATRFGAPEVQLGLVPGAGGTQSLPRVVGLVPALDLITTGKDVSSDRADRMGLVDQVVHPEIVVDVALGRARRLVSAEPEPDSDGRRGSGLVDRTRSLALERNPVGRRVVLRKAAERVQQETKGNLPAPARAVEVIGIGLTDGPDAGLDAEARAFGELAAGRTSRNLRALFLAREAANHRSHAEAAPLAVRKVGIVGAGLMGAGIAEVTATKARLPVRLRDLDHDKIRDGLRSIGEVLFTVRQLDHDEGRKVLARITTTVDTTGFGDVDLAVEAVVEKPDVKRQVFEELEAALPDEAVIATNTSTLPLARLVDGLRRPERLVGMHYFSPVGKVPLLEVIRGEQTDPIALATAVDIGRRQGKTVVVVADSPGFYTSRILGRYLAEAAAQAAEGVPVDRIDDALEAAGFAVGPFRLLEDVGIDIAHDISRVLHGAFGDRLGPPALLGLLVDDDRLGSKNGRGLYTYTSDDGEVTRTDKIDPDTRALIGAPDNRRRSPDEIAERCLLQLADEAVRCLDEGVVASPADGDLAAVLGLGFPPQLGGPFRYLDDSGPAQAAGRIRALGAGADDPRWSPADLLVRTGQEERRFHDGPAHESDDGSPNRPHDDRR